MTLSLLTTLAVTPLAIGDFSGLATVIAGLFGIVILAVGLGVMTNGRRGDWSNVLSVLGAILIALMVYRLGTGGKDVLDNVSATVAGWAGF